MKKSIIFGIVVCILLISAPGCPFQATLDINDIKNEAECKEKFGDNYIWVSRCCPDMNHNKMCDGDEGQAPCNNECETNGCIDDFTPYACITGDDNCKHKKEGNIEVGKCNVECIKDEGCRLGQKCRYHKCEDKRCGDGECDDTENCKCEDCKKSLKDTEICCDGITIIGNCCSNPDCKEENNTCVKNKCIYCRDGECNGDENCLICPEDCKEEGKVCCEEGILKETCEEAPESNETDNKSG